MDILSHGMTTSKVFSVPTRIETIRTSRRQLTRFPGFSVPTRIETPTGYGRRRQSGFLAYLRIETLSSQSLIKQFSKF